MFSRRFLLLTVILVSLNLALWFASPGLALRKAVIQQLFGPKMVKAQVYEKNGVVWNLDRGVITSVTPSQVTLKEASGHVQQIPLSPATKVITRTGARLAPTALATGWRVLVTWPANGAATSVDVERIPHARGHGKTGIAPAAPASSLS
jgi:hypothetical protein